MPKICRVNDIGHGQCFAGHPDVPVGQPKDFTNVIISGASTVFLNNQPIAFVTSMGNADCGHHTIAISGSDTVFVENHPIHRLTDIGAIIEGDGVYHMISASDDTGN
jgi:uncharacterized Zn-binding protein involved in type VI secretion